MVAPTTTIVYKYAMLCEYLTKIQSPPDTQHNNNDDNAGQAFIDAIDFLYNPNKFPNARINILAGVMRRFVYGEHNGIQIGISTVSETLTFMSGHLESVDDSVQTEQGGFILPNNFANQAKNNPLRTLGQVVLAGTLARGFCSGMIRPNKDNTPGFHLYTQQGQALVAEALLTLYNMAESEGIKEATTGSLASHQHAAITDYPDGFASLTSEARRFGIDMQPMPALTTRQIDQIAELDYQAHLPGIRETRRALDETVRFGMWSSLGDIERVLRFGIDSPTHLHAPIALGANTPSTPQGVTLIPVAEVPITGNHACNHSQTAFKANLERLDTIKPLR